MKEIVITLTVKLDDDVYESIKGRNIGVDRVPYIKVGKKFLHHIVCGTDETLVVDHKNRDKLDNRRQNLRIVNRTQNNLNRAVTGSIPYAGVTYNKSGNSYAACLMVQGKRTVVNAKTPFESAILRDYLVRKNNLQDYATINIPEIVLDDETAKLFILKRNTGKAAKENVGKEVYFRPATKRRDTGKWVYHLTFKGVDGFRYLKIQDKLEAIYLYWLYLGDVQRSSKAFQRWKEASRVGSQSRSAQRQKAKI